jgi:hypothetical protein
VARATPVTLAACDATPFVEVHGRAHADKLERQLLNQGDDMKTIKIKLKTKRGERVTYTGLFACTIDAVIDATERFEVRSIFACVA